MTTSYPTKSDETQLVSVPWASKSIGDEPHATIKALQEGLTVSLIATKRADFVTCPRTRRWRQLSSAIATISSTSCPLLKLRPAL
jgi:hypothetical protein